MQKTDTTTLRCKLCGESAAAVGALQQSHIIPRFFILKTKDANGQMLEFRKADKQYSLTQADWKELLLCVACEKIMKKHEDYLNEVLYLRRKRPILFERKDHTCISTSSDALALALVTIFWRATVSSIEPYQWSKVPDYVRDDMRLWILQNQIYPNWGSLLDIKILTLHSDDKLQAATPFLTRPFIRQGEDHFEFVFISGGFCWSYTVPPRGRHTLGDQSRAGALIPGRHSVRIAKVPFHAIPELAEGVQLMQDAPMPPHIAARMATSRQRWRSGSRP